MDELVNLGQVISAPAYFFDTVSHRLLAVNSAFCEMMQYTEVQLLLMKVEDLRPEEDLSALRKALASAPPQGTVEWKYRRASGQIIFVRLS